MDGHCAEHEERTRRLTENTVCIHAMKRERQQEYDRMRVEADAMVSRIINLENGKVDNGMFKFLMAGVGVVALVILGTLFTMTGSVSEIKADVRVLTAQTEQQHN